MKKIDLQKKQWPQRLSVLGTLSGNYYFVRTVFDYNFHKIPLI